MSPETEQARVMDVESTVLYLRSIGAGAATQNFVRGLISRGEVPHVRIGKKFYVSKSALDRWIETRERKK